MWHLRLFTILPPTLFPDLSPIILPLLFAPRHSSQRLYTLWCSNTGLTTVDSCISQPPCTYSHESQKWAKPVKIPPTCRENLILTLLSSPTGATDWPKQFCVCKSTPITGEMFQGTVSLSSSWLQCRQRKTRVTSHWDSSHHHHQCRFGAPGKRDRCCSKCGCRRAALASPGSLLECKFSGPPPVRIRIRKGRPRNVLIKSSGDLYARWAREILY